MRRWQRWFPLLLFVLALAVRVGALLATHFDGLYGQDPFAYYDFAITLRRALVAGQPPPSFFWPIGYPLLAALAMTFAGVQPLAAQLVSVVAGALVAPLVYAVVVEVKNAQPGVFPGAGEAHWGAVVAGLLAASAAQLLLSSLSIMSDASALAWATLSAWIMVRYLNRLQLRWLALAALALALAILTRWVYGLLILPWGVGSLLAWWRAKVPWRQMATAAVLAVAIGVTVIGVQFTADLGRSELSHVGNFQTVGWNPTRALQSTVSSSSGTVSYERPIGLYYALAAIHPAFVFPLLAPFLLLGLWQLRRAPRPLIVMLIGWPLIVYLFLVGVPWQNPRFSLVLFPPLLLFVGLGVDWVWHAIRPGWQPWLVAYCLLALVGSLAWSARDIGRFTNWKAAQLATTQWTAAQLPPDATLLTFGLTLTLEHYTTLNTHDIYLLDENDLQSLVTSESSLYLLLDPANVEAQWQGESPGLNYNWLQQNTHLLEIGRFAPYVLFRITPAPKPAS